MVKQIAARIPIPDEEIEAFCRKWDVQRFELFGSVLREDFDPEKSDVDVMVTLTKERSYTLFDIVHMQDELGSIFGRKVHLSERPAVEQSRNHFRRRHILENAQEVYVVP